jgi:NMD protein affecting ribosome stability and mRNA decay
MPDDQHPLEPAEALAARNPIHQLGESEEYRAARQRLLVREYELRRLTESVAAERRALPPGAEVTREYRFEGEKGAVKLPTCSAAMTPSSFTATCSVRSARRHVRCARAS